MQLHQTNKLKIYIPAATKDEESIMYEVPILSVEEFLSYTKSNPTDFIQNCEVIILEDGRIVKVQPSHTMVIHSIVRYSAKLKVSISHPVSYNAMNYHKIQDD